MITLFKAFLLTFIFAVIIAAILLGIVAWVDILFQTKFLGKVETMLFYYEEELERGMEKIFEKN